MIFFGKTTVNVLHIGAKEKTLKTAKRSLSTPFSSMPPLWLPLKIANCANLYQHGTVPLPFSLRRRGWGMRCIERRGRGMRCIERRGRGMRCIEEKGAGGWGALRRRGQGDEVHCKEKRRVDLWINKSNKRTKDCRFKNTSKIKHTTPVLTNVRIPLL